MALMARYPDKRFDLAIVDPPYGIGQCGDKNYTRGCRATPKNYKPYYGGDKYPPNKDFFNELFRVSKDQIIFGANHFIEQFSKNSSAWLVWDKENGNFSSADCELAWTSFKSAVRIFRFRWNGMMQGNMKDKEERIHPNQKPVALYKWILFRYAKPGDKILDTHLGSGSIAIACMDAGLDLTACETDKDYFEKAMERVENHRLQPVLFEGGGTA
jgi:site-specific DNA-methyltransferase (adenine-specific)